MIQLVEPSAGSFVFVFSLIIDQTNTTRVTIRTDFLFGSKKSWAIFPVNGPPPFSDGRISNSDSTKNKNFEKDDNPPKNQGS